ncbi:UTP--glucose-1-phosphate uridylyltransferase family [Zychaea mexicana]|uniref:UTP--glucose-1-phosphate uridylyltransferase family n=1 Tax=Zychaea mexicana TaxID=64656 RepID=UPI0022FE2471|nr:UTP--glucose-1-phosphate uridylyltransferase family [Zychaea mexicana]KAI9487960.1 UTP--glucose-1-phosphate uridylyltransferase family [Zychaea mexicana]
MAERGGLSPPRSDRHHPQTLSMLDFKGAQYAAAAKSVKAELDHLKSQAGTDRKLKTEMDAFYLLFTRYLDDTAKGNKLDWDKIQSPSEEQIVRYDTIPKAGAEDLSKLAVLKLNGGLGTTMGCVGPKSAIEVRDGMTFLDVSVRQIEYLNKKHNVDVPFILMNSFNTDDETKRIVKKYETHNISIHTFDQSKYPRIKKESLLPVPRKPGAPIDQWYPPGHGDLYESLYNSGILDQLLSHGKEYLFVSNVDNLGATVDVNILHHMIEKDMEFIMEVTDKTKADIKGGTLIDYNGQIRLLEIAQVPDEHVEDFKSIKKFHIFNTNNLWINLKAVKRIMDEDALDLEIIVNNKSTDSGEKVIQLETAVGAGIKHFKNAHGVNVPRNRFLPVKSTSDLFLVTSDLYSLVHGELSMNPQRMFHTTPLVKLGDEFKKVNNFLSRFKKIPHILELDHLTVTGDVTFGAKVELRGTVIIVANHGERIDIPPGSILENKVITGNLRILDH